MGDGATGLSRAGRRVRLPGSDWGSPLGRPLPRGRHGYPLEQVTVFQRIRLLDAFAADVGRHGFAGTLVGDVCAAAGASTKAFYAAFGSKERCLLQAFDVGARILCDHAVAAARRSGTGVRGPSAGRAAVDTVLGILADNPPFARLAVLEVPRLGPEGAGHLDAAAAALVERLGAGASGLRASLDPGPGAPGRLSPDLRLGALVAGAVRLLAGYVADGRVASLRDLTPALAAWAATCVPLPVVPAGATT